MQTGQKADSKFIRIGANAGILPETRLSLIGGEQYAGGSPVALRDIARELGLNKSRVKAIVQTLGLSPDEDGSDGQYPAWVVPVIKDELVWEAAYNSLPDQLSFSRIAQELGRTNDWVLSQLSGLESPEIDEFEAGKEGYRRPLLPKTLLLRLREISLAVPLAGVWLNQHQMVERLGCGRQWVSGRLEMVDSEFRRSPLNGLVSQHYPPEVFEALQREHDARPTYGADWLTARAITQLLGKSRRWVDRVLKEIGPESEIRQDDNGRPREHYSPAAVALVAARLDEVTRLATQNPGLTRRELARALGRTIPWLNPRLARIDVTPEPTLTPSGHVRDLYPHEVVEILRAMG